MICVVDNNIFSYSFKNLSSPAFEDIIWKPWSESMQNGSIISVEEVYRELELHWKSKENFAFNWLKKHKEFFEILNNDECKYLVDIYSNPKFREGVKEKNLRSGNPEADAFIVAKAKAIGAVVVTAESNEKANAEKIPNICVELGVPYIMRDDFYIVLKNISDGKGKFDDVKIWTTLNIDDQKPIPPSV